MPVTEYERNQLFGWFEEHMGKERAATMMSLLPPVGWGDVVTKRDLDHAVERLETKAELHEMATKAELQELRSDLQRTFVTWILAAQTTVVAIVGLLLVALR